MQNSLKTKKHEEICRELTELYVKKNADYGDSFGKSYKEYGDIMVAIRLEDKLSRYKKLIKHEAQVKEETIDDTLIDLANYTIMALIERSLELEVE